MNVIGLTGMKRVGKDTVASILCRHRNYAQLAFADTLREMLKPLGIPEKYVEDKLSLIPGLGVSYTYLMQTLGTDWGRNMVARDIWVRALAAKAQALAAQGAAGIVISDVRYEDEAVFVRQALYGRIYRVVGPLGVVANTHSSETPLPSLWIEGEIANTGSISQLEEVVLALL